MNRLLLEVFLLPNAFKGCDNLLKNIAVILLTAWCFRTESVSVVDNLSSSNERQKKKLNGEKNSSNEIIWCQTCQKISYFGGTRSYFLCRSRVK